MTDQSLFDDKSTQETPAPVSTLTVDPAVEDLLKQIKNEKGEPKYDNLPKALEGLRNAQEYIPQLKTQLAEYERQLAELKAQSDTASKLQEVIDRLTVKQDQQGSPTSNGLDEQTVQDLVVNLLERKDAEKTATQNIQEVDKALRTAYGDKAPEVLKQKATELGVSLQELKRLSAQSPKVVLTLLSATQASNVKPTTSSVNTSDFLRPQDDVKLERPSKSLLAGASSAEQIEYMRKVRDAVYKKHNVETH